MWWLLWIPVWIGFGALGAYAAHCQIQNMQRMIDDTVEKTLSKPVEKPIAKPSPPKPPSRKVRQVIIDGVTYRSVIVDNEEYVGIGLYHKALEAFFKESERGSRDCVKTD